VFDLQPLYTLSDGRGGRGLAPYQPIRAEDKRTVVCCLGRRPRIFLAGALAVGMTGLPVLRTGADVGTTGLPVPRTGAELQGF